MCFLNLSGFSVSWLARTFDTIARKPEHDKATGLCRTIGLEPRARDRHCLTCRGALPTGRFFQMTQTSNRFFDEIGRLMNDAAGAAQGVKREIDTVVRNQAEKILRDLDIVKREEFEAAKEMARLAREENEALKARISALEAKLGVSPSAPGSGSMKTDG
jgi:BMFP domain-containing protein YqiC